MVTAERLHAHRTPAEIDTDLFPLWERIAKAQARILGYTHEWTGKGRNRHQVPRTTPLYGYEEKGLAAARDELTQAKAAAEPLEAEFDARGGWSRVFLVTNADGHVHRSMHCQTCHPTTSFALMPELSGLSEAEMVAQVRERACTVCYPSAPLHPAWIAGEAEREAAEKAKQDAKCPGGGTFVDLTPNEYALYVAPSKPCPECGWLGAVSRSQHGAKIRSHKPANNDDDEDEESNPLA